MLLSLPDDPLWVKVSNSVRLDVIQSLTDLGPQRAQFLLLQGPLVPPVTQRFADQLASGSILARLHGSTHGIGHFRGQGNSDRPFDEGDYVDIAGTAGTIQSVSIIATTVTTPDNQVVVIPNQQVWEGVITNLTARDTRRVDLIFSISYDDDIQRAIQVLNEAVAEHPLTLEELAPVIAVTALAESSIEILCGAWTRTSDYLSVYRGLLADVKTRFDAAGITIPYPQRDVHVHNAGV